MLAGQLYTYLGVHGTLLLSESVPIPLIWDHGYRYQAVRATALDIHTNKAGRRSALLPAWEMCMYELSTKVTFN